MQKDSRFCLDVISVSKIRLRGFIGSGICNKSASIVVIKNRPALIVFERMKRP